MSEYFNDPQFELVNPSNNLIKADAEIKWLRPKEIVKEPVLGIFSISYESHAVIQGSLDNCAFISACDTLSSHPHLLKRIFKDLNENFNCENYNGRIEINLWLDEKWTSIHIDDRLPTVTGKLYYGSCKNVNHFWLPLLEKALAKVMGSYENLIAIDGGYVLYCLTGGIVMRFNPTYVNERSFMLNCLRNAKLNNLLIGIVGSELSNSTEFLNATRRSGHSFTILDLVEISKYNKLFIKLKNSQPQMKINFDSNKDDQKILNEFNLNENINSNELYFSIDEFFNLFEILNILVKLDQFLSFKNEIFLSDVWSVIPQGDNKIENFLKVPHFVVEFQNKDKSSNLIQIALNMTIYNFNKFEFFGYFMLPIRERIVSVNESIFFVNYSFNKQTLYNLNPFTDQIKLLPGRYIIGAIIKSDYLPKRFNLRIATLEECQIIEHKYEKIFSNDIYFQINETNTRIKLIMSKCCVCQCVIDDSYFTSGSSVFCHDCYNSTFLCQICSKLVGKEYFTLDNRILCQHCINNYHNI